VQIISDPKALFESGFERLNARAPRMDQRAIDVEKQQALLCVCHGEKNDEIRMTNDEGMTKINSRKLSESNDEMFLQRMLHIFVLRH
jgi:hypothetical protein